MSRNYQREERDWRRQPSFQEEDQWSNNRSDDDFSMGLGQESRGSRPEEYGRRGQESGSRSSGREGVRRTGGYGESGRGPRLGGSYRSRELDHYGPEDYRSSDSGRDQGNEDFQNSSRWQRSQFRPYEGDARRNPGDRPWNEPYEGVQRGWYDALPEAMHRGEGQFAGHGPRNYRRADDRIEEEINERLTRHGMLDATDIEVSVQNGEVTLRGSVDNRQAKRIAEDIADAVFGVKELTNQIKVRQRGDAREKTDNKHETETTGKQPRRAS